MSETKSVSLDFYAGLFSPLIFLGFFVPMVLLKAWVLTYLWQWYVMPVFGVPPLRLVFAFGLSLTINYLLPHIDPPKEQEKTLAPMVKMILSPVLAILFGWIGTWFI
jgi:hypothetical protein